MENPTEDHLQADRAAEQAAKDAAEKAEQTRIADEQEARRAAEEEAAVKAEPQPAATRLRAFEDEHLGKDVMRIGGRIERGSGSPYQNPKVMPPELRRQHAALEHLIESEQTLADAHTKLLQAEADHEAALAAAEPRPDAGE